MTSHIDNMEEKAIAFMNLHKETGIFVIPNPWDAGTAKVLTSLGFKALATSSSCLAFGLGKPDGHASITRSVTLENAKAILEATSLPVSADLVNGFGDEPSICAETILLASQAGLVGGSIEDSTGNLSDPIYEFHLAVERVKAAVQAARRLTVPFMLTARAENLICGRPDLNDTIKRLEAFADAGADVLFAPGLKSLNDVETVVKALHPKPVNVIMGLSGCNLTLDMLDKVGVKRVSLGSAFLRAAYGAFYRAADEVLLKGTFNFAEKARPSVQLNNLFK